MLEKAPNKICKELINSLNNENYLYYIKTRNIIFYDIELQKKLVQNSKKIIIKINDKDPFDYIEEFTFNIYKNKHTQYTINFRQICGGVLGKYPFNSNILII